MRQRHLGAAAARVLPQLLVLDRGRATCSRTTRPCRCSSTATTICSSTSTACWCWIWAASTSGCPAASPSSAPTGNGDDHRGWLADPADRRDRSCAAGSDRPVHARRAQRHRRRRRLSGAAPRPLNLTPGQIYEIAVFHADRHPTESNYQLTLSGFTTNRSNCQPRCGDGVVSARRGVRLRRRHRTVPGRLRRSERRRRLRGLFDPVQVRTVLRRQDRQRPRAVRPRARQRKHQPGRAGVHLRLHQAALLRRRHPRPRRGLRPRRRRQRYDGLILLGDVQRGHSVAPVLIG